MPNSFAYLMLLAWPAMAAALFRLLPFERAVIWSILAAYLFLPPRTAFDLPMLPPLDKVSIPSLATAACCVLLCGRMLRVRPRSIVATLLLLLAVASPFGTVVTNGEPATFGGLVLPGLRVYDAVSMIANQIVFILPLFLGRQFLATEAAQRELLVAFLVAGLVYSVPMLVEVRLSPQMNTWIYGFFQHDFVQMIRDDGFRPIVFLSHGLMVAFLTMTSFIAAIALFRGSMPSARPPLALQGMYLGMMLVLCKSLGSLLFAIFLFPLVLLARRGMQIRVAALLALLAFCYPLMRGGGLVPVDAMLAQAEIVSAERAQSLQVRFDNEAALLERASEKPLFGWGGWGRNRIYDEYGRDVSTTDGRWIIVIGMLGWSGYIAEFGLLALPLVLLALRTRRMEAAQISPWTGPLALLLGINLIDLIPNSSLTPLTWLLCGALLGIAEQRRTQTLDRLVPQTPAARPRPLLDTVAPPGGRTILETTRAAERRTIL